MDQENGEPAANVAPWPGQSLGLPKNGVGSLATPMSRLGAQLIDGLIFLALQLLIALVRFAITKDFKWLNTFPLQVAYASVAVFYGVAMIALWGQTLGKMAVGIKVVSVQAMEVPGWSGSLRRALLFNGPTYVDVFIASGLSSNLSFGVLLIDVLWILRDRNRQALHDKLAGTIVVRETRAVETEARRKSGR